MRSNSNTHKNVLVLAPWIGMALFVVFYGLAVSIYPGGSNFDAHQIGFDIKSNYLCDLLDTHTPNGLPNPSRAYSRLALTMLCCGLIVFWYNLPLLFNHKGVSLKIMQATGVLALAFTLFLAAGNHDVLVRIAGIFGAVALITTFVELFRARRIALLGLGIWCLVIFAFNYYIYETGILITALPMIQKITFLSFMLWFVLMNLALYNRIKLEENKNVHY